MTSDLETVTLKLQTLASMGRLIQYIKEYERTDVNGNNHYSYKFVGFTGNTMMDITKEVAKYLELKYKAKRLKIKNPNSRFPRIYISSQNEELAMDLYYQLFDKLEKPINFMRIY